MAVVCGLGWWPPAGPAPRRPQRGPQVGHTGHPDICILTKHAGELANVRLFVELRRGEFVDLAHTADRLGSVSTHKRDGSEAAANHVRGFFGDAVPHPGMRLKLELGECPWLWAPAGNSWVRSGAPSHGRGATLGRNLR